MIKKKNFDLFDSNRRPDFSSGDPATRVQVEAGTAAHAADRRGALDRFKGSFTNHILLLKIPKI